LVPVRVHEFRWQVHVKIVEGFVDSIVAIPFLATSIEHAQLTMYGWARLSSAATTSWVPWKVGERLNKG